MKTVTVQPARSIMSREDLMKASRIRHACHSNAYNNMRSIKGLSYVEGYLIVGGCLGIPHAINKRPDGVYIDTTTDFIESYEFVPIREYTYDEITDIFSESGCYFLTIGDSDWFISDIGGKQWNQYESRQKYPPVAVLSKPSKP